MNIWSVDFNQSVDVIAIRIVRLNWGIFAIKMLIFIDAIDDKMRSRFKCTRFEFAWEFESENIAIMIQTSFLQKS